MKDYIKISITAAILILWSCTQIQAQVWPGDTNLDSIVNNFDVLHLGRGFGQTGEARGSQGIAFDSYGAPSNDWSNVFYGTEPFFSDCNGDGIIDSLDLEAVVQNYNLSYGVNPYSPPIPSSDDILQISTANDTIEAGEELLYIISFGDIDAPKEDVLGIAYTFKIGAGFITYDDVVLDYNIENNWITGNNPKLDIITPLDELGRSAGQTRIDQEGQTGFGEVARLSSTITEDLVGGFTEDIVPFEVEIKHVIVSYYDRLDTIQGSKDTIYIRKNLVSNTEILHQEPEFRIYPNPVNNQLHFNTSLNIPIQLEVKNMLGESIQSLEWKLSSPNTIWDVSHYPSGIYFLLIHYEQQYKTIKFIVE